MGKLKDAKIFKMIFYFKNLSLFFLIFEKQPRAKALVYLHNSKMKREKK